MFLIFRFEHDILLLLINCWEKQPEVIDTRIKKNSYNLKIFEKKKLCQCQLGKHTIFGSWRVSQIHEKKTSVGLFFHIPPPL